MYFFIICCLLLVLSLNKASRQLVGFDVMSHIYVFYDKTWSHSYDSKLCDVTKMAPDVAIR